MLPASKNSAESENSENCNSIMFTNVKKTYNIDTDNGKPKPITVEIHVDSQVKVSSRDWVGIFPSGWTDFRQNVNFEYMIGRPLNKEGTQWKLVFSFTDVMKELFVKSYQFVYVNHSFQIMGASTHFYLTSCDTTFKNDALVNTPYQCKIYKQHSETVVDSKNVKQLRQQFQNRSPRQIHGNALRPVVSDDVLYSRKFLFDVYSPECRNCYRLPEMMRKQETLYRELKNSAELRRRLEEQVHMLQKELELSIAAQSKLRIELNIEKNDNAVYKTFTHSLLSKLAKGNVVHVTDGFNNYMVYDCHLDNRNGKMNGITKNGYNQLIQPQPFWHWIWVPMLTFGFPSDHFANLTSLRQTHNEMIMQKSPSNQVVKKNGKRSGPLKNSDVPHTVLLKAYIGAQEKSLRILSEKLSKAIKKEPVQLHRAKIIDLDEATTSGIVKNTTVLVTSPREENNSENPCDLNNNSDNKNICNGNDDASVGEETDLKDN